MNKLISLVFITGIASCSMTSTSEDNVENDNSDKDAEIGLVSSEGLRLEDIRLPPGFKIDVFARVKGARSMALSRKGTLYIGSRGDKVYAVKDTNGDWKADEKYVVAEGLNMPNGVALRDGNLYVAEVSKMWSFDNIDNNLNEPSSPILIYKDYPKDNHHGWKYIAFGPDGKLYVPVGAPCNICESKNEIYASITRMNADGSEREIYAHGVRNTVGFTWHPETGDMWFTDNGRDWLGNDEPPCELNRITEAGQHFGYPYCHGGYFKDPEFGGRRPCEDFVKPAQNLGPHVAPLGVKFCTSKSFPNEYRMLAFIAEHGSWNRDQKVGHTGYKITLVAQKNGVGVSYTDFATGFLDAETNSAWARPVDIIFASDGSMLVSDDLGGTVFRIWYEG